MPLHPHVDKYLTDPWETGEKIEGKSTLSTNYDTALLLKYTFMPFKRFQSLFLQQPALPPDAKFNVLQHLACCRNTTSYQLASGELTPYVNRNHQILRRATDHTHRRPHPSNSANAFVMRSSINYLIYRTLPKLSAR